MKWSRRLALTFDTLFSYQPHPYGHSFNAQQDGLIMGDNGAEFAAGLAPQT